MNRRGAQGAGGHYRHEGLRALLERRPTFGRDLKEDVVPIAGSMRRRYLGTVRNASDRETLVAEVLTEESVRYMRVDCGDILLQGRKDEPVAMSVVTLEDGAMCLLLAEESLFAREPHIQTLIAPKRSFGGNGNMRRIPLDRIAEGLLPTRQLSPAPGLMGIVFQKQQPAIAI